MRNFETQLKTRNALRSAQSLKHEKKQQKQNGFQNEKLNPQSFQTLRKDQLFLDQNSRYRKLDGICNNKKQSQNKLSLIQICCKKQKQEIIKNDKNSQFTNNGEVQETDLQAKNDKDKKSISLHPHPHEKIYNFFQNVLENYSVSQMKLQQNLYIILENKYQVPEEKLMQALFLTICQIQNQNFLNRKKENMQVQQINLNSKVQNSKQQQNNLRDYFKRLKKKFKKIINSHEEKLVVQQIENKIFDQTIDIILFHVFKLIIKQDLSMKIGKSIIDILFMRNEAGITIIQLILSYITSFDIITYLLIENQMSNEQYQIIKFDLLHKLKPQKSFISQINQTIQFLKLLFDLNSMPKLFNSFKIEFTKKINAERQNYLSDFNIFIDLTKREQLKLLKEINRLCLCNGCENQLKLIYQQAKQIYHFQNLIVSKKIPLGHSSVNKVNKIILKELNLNIFHQIALKKNWKSFLQYSNPYYQYPDNSQITPFMMLFQRAPLKIIKEYIQNYPHQLEQGIKQTTPNGLNLIHCLCMNQEITRNCNQDLDFVLQILQDQEYFKELLIQPYHDQIPLVFYLDYNVNVSQKMMIFLCQFDIPAFNLEYYIFQMTILIRQDIPESNPKKQAKQNNIQSKIKHQQKFKVNEINNSENLELFQFYHIYIQLAKQVIKKNFTITFPWLRNFFVPIQQNCGEFETLLNIMIRNSQFIEVKKQLKLMQVLMEQYGIQRTSHQKSLYMARLISLKHELQQRPNKDVNNEINKIIMKLITKEPDLLIQPLNEDCCCLKKNTKNQNKLLITQYTVYVLILKLNDCFLNQNCLNQDINFKNKWNLSIKILSHLFQLRLISKMNDKVSLSLCSYIQQECDKQQVYPYLKDQLSVLELRKFNFAHVKLFENILNFKQSPLLNLRDKNSFSYNKLFSSTNQKFLSQSLPACWFWQIKIPLTNDYLNKNNLVCQTIVVNRIKSEQYETYYDWQIAGIQFKIIDYSQIVIKNQNLKQNVITYQLQNKLQSILFALSVYPEALNDFQKLCQTQSYENPNLLSIFLTELPLKDLLTNNAYDNLKFCIYYLNISNFQLVNILAKEYFSGQTDCTFRKGFVYDYSHIKSFQTNLDKLLTFLLNYRSQFKERIDVNMDWIRSAPTPHFFKYVNLTLFNQLRNCVQYLAFVDQFKNISIYHYILMAQNLEIQIIMLQDYIQKRCFLTEVDQNLLKICYLDVQLAEIILNHVEVSCNRSQKHIPIGKTLQVLLMLIFESTPSRVINFLIETQNFITISRSQFFYFYSILLQKKNFQILNKFLFYDELMFNKRNFTRNNLCQIGIGGLFNLDNELVNYYRALIYPYCSVLNLHQYEQCLVENNFNVKQLSLHLLICLRDGLFQKVEMLIGKIGSFSLLVGASNFLKIFERIMKFILDKQFPFFAQFHYNLSLSKRQENFLEFNKQYQFFEIPEEYSIFRKRIKQKRPISVLKQLAELEILQSIKQSSLGLNAIQIIRKQEALALNLLYIQEKSYSEQNQNILALFQASVSQLSNHVRCLDLISSWSTAKILISLSPMFELYDAIKQPRPNQIKLSTELIWFFASHLQNKKIFKIPAQLNLQKRQSLQLIYANYRQAQQNIKINGQRISITFKIMNIVQPMQEQFVTDLIVENQLYSPSQDDLEYIIVKMKYKNEKIVSILNQTFKGLQKLKFNWSTQYYAKRNFKLLPELSYDIEKYDKTFYRIVQYRCAYFNKFIKAQINLKKLSPTQIFLIFGKHEHLNENPPFSKENLLCALISGNIKTVVYVLQLCLIPKEIIINYSIFQLMVSRSFGDLAIQTFLYKFTLTNGMKLPSNLLLLDHVPILYFIVLSRKKDLFEKCYLKPLSAIYGTVSISDVVQQQLSIKPFNKDFDILSIALKKKSYFVLDFCDDIITKDHLKYIDHVDLQLIEQVLSIDNFNQSKQSQFYNLLKKYQPLCQQQCVFRQTEKKFLKFSFQITKHNYIRDKQLNQLLELEKACINEVFQLGEVFIFKNPLLSLEMAQNKWQMLEFYRYSPLVLSKVIEQNKYQNGKIIIQEEQFKQVIENYQNYRILNDPIFLELIQSNPGLGFKIIKPQNFTLQLIVAYFRYFSNSIESEEMASVQKIRYYEQKQKQVNSQKYFDQKIQLANEYSMRNNLIYAFYLLYSISQDKNDNKFLINELNYYTVFSLYNLLSTQNYSQEKLIFSQKIRDFLKNILQCNILHESLNKICEIVKEEKSIEKAIMKAILYIQQINIIMINFVTELKNKCKNIPGLPQSIFKTNFCTIFINDISSKLMYQKLVNNFVVPLQYRDNQFSVDYSLIDDFVVQQQNLNNINLKLKQNDSQQNKWLNFDFSQIHKNDYEQLNQIDNFMVFLKLMEPLEKVGFYEISTLITQSEQQEQTQVRRPSFQEQLQLMSQRVLTPRKSSLVVNRQNKEFFKKFYPQTECKLQIRSSMSQEYQKEEIFAEFYHFVQPRVILSLELLSKVSYLEKYNCKRVIQRIIADLKNYSCFVNDTLQDKSISQWKITFPFYIKNQTISYQDQLFSTYNIQVIFNLLAKFTEKVKLFYEGIQTQGHIQFRINSISFFEVLVSKYIEIEKLEDKEVNIYAIINQLLNWDTLIVILHQILYHNLVKAVKTLKEIRGVYIEFIESQNSTFIFWDKNKGLDRIFQFNQTTYQIYKKVLIIRLSVVILNQYNMRKQQSSICNILRQDPIYNEYFIINEFDFFIQIFTPDQIIQHLFNKQENDRQLLSYSNQLSSMLNKTITLSVNHSSLTQIFEGEILKLKRQKQYTQKLRNFERIFHLLRQLNDYFKFELFQYLKNLLLGKNFDEMFNIRLQQLFLALKENIPFGNLIFSNKRKIQLDQKSQMFQRINKASEWSSSLAYQFVFQLDKTYFINNCKLGDICIVTYCEKQHSHLIECQLIHNSRPGSLLFLKNDIKSQQKIVQNQNQYQTIFISNKDIIVISIEDLISIMLFKQFWPSDRNFNQAIFDVFVTDSQGAILQCNEPKFQSTIAQIQRHLDDQEKQKNLDQVFGIGATTSSNDLSLAQLVLIFPDQINFSFASKQQLKKLQQNIQNVYVHLKGDKFQLGPMEIPQVSMACYFETHPKVKSFQNLFIKYVQENNELQNIYLEFDDELNENPIFNISNILKGLNIFEEFQTGFSQFKENQYLPKLNNSLQYMFQIQSISCIKVDFIKSTIKKVEFIYQKQKGEKGLIVYVEQCLKLYTILNDDGDVIVPNSNQITQFFYDLIVQFQKNQLVNFFTDNDPQLQIFPPSSYQIEDAEAIVNVIMIIKYMKKLIELQDAENKLKVHIFSKNNIPKELLKNSIYQFYGNDELIINYSCFSDFNLSDFFMDYLNCKSSFQWNKYNNEIKYIGPEIISEQSFLNPNQSLINVENIEEIKTHVFQFKKQKIINIDTLDPQHFNQIFIVFQMDGIYSKLISVKSSLHSQLIPYFNQFDQNQESKKYFYLLIYDICSNQGIENYLRNVKFVCNENNVRKKENLGNLLTQQGHKDAMKIQANFVSSSILLIEFVSDKALQLSIYSREKEFSFSKINKRKKIMLEYTALNIQDLSKTRHCHVQINQQLYHIDSEEKQQINFGSGNLELMKIIQHNTNEKTNEKLKHKDYDQDLFTLEIQTGNTINMLSKQDLRVASRAGDIRIDYLEFKDNQNNLITNFYCSNVILVHTLFPQIQYIPSQQKEGKGLDLTWCPHMKGVYKLYINDVRIKGRFIVLAGTPNVEKSSIVIPEIKTHPFYEILPIVFELRDEFDNQYGDIESDTYSDCRCEIQTKNQSCKLVTTFQKINKSGQIKVNAHIEPYNAVSEEDEMQLQFIINKKIKKTQLIKLSGIGLEKRRRNFRAEIQNTFYTSTYNLTIKRTNFLQDLLSLEEKKMNFNFNIKFQDELGIDAGGLKREFYDMIGNTLKNEAQKFFQPVKGDLEKYFLHNNFNEIKNKERYACLFGKLIANAIGNNQLIGIDIIYPFWKVVYGEDIIFEDLKIIWDQQTFKNYNLLRELSEEEIQSLYLDFTYQIGNQTVNLIPDGSKTEVNKQNVEQYLNKTAEYVIFKQFEAIYKPFIQGFTSVLNINIFKKWWKPSEISLLTQGLLDLNPNILLSKIIYTGGQPSHKSYFEMYVSQANQQTLKKMLKFITGTSAIPFDQSSYTIRVEFQSHIGIGKLPVAHTCFNSIEIPYYQNYAQLKQKLDIAFTIGLEAGFGFG